MKLKVDKAPTDFKGPFDHYVTEATLRTLELAKNKAKWRKIIVNDLYSKTPTHAIPDMQKYIIKN